MKKCVVLMIAVAFVLGMVSLGSAAYEFYGIVTNVKGTKITVKSSAGKTKTIQSNRQWKVGDKVRVQGNNAIEPWDGKLPPSVQRTPMGARDREIPHK